MKTNERYDVIVGGAGPAGSLMAWSLARKGVKVLLLERDKFPREKVCGDFIEPRGLRVLEQVGCFKDITNEKRLPINQVSLYLRGQCAYKGEIPFYGHHQDLQPHGFIISRYEFDNKLAQAASQAGAVLVEQAQVRSVKVTKTGVTVEVQHSGGTNRFKSKLIVGADGVHSTVARSQGLLVDDPRYMAVSQRAYMEGLSHESGESTFFFDQDLFPGYGWMFPMPGGQANVGVGILLEAKERYNIHVPTLFNDFVQKLKKSHPNCRRLQKVSRAIGGIVKTYGSGGRNYFERGLLVGDAGSFVDPMTGEGITAAMESSIIAAPILIRALEEGDFSPHALADYEKQFRAYFDPSLGYVDLVACIMRNRHFCQSWLDLVSKGCEVARDEPEFARISGATFGGMEIYPIKIAMQVWQRAIREFNPLFNLAQGDIRSFATSFTDLIGLQGSWWRSLASDPVWHAQWTADVMQKWLRVSAGWPLANQDQRAKGLFGIPQ